jgi:hypothetical protein
LLPGWCAAFSTICEVTRRRDEKKIVLHQTRAVSHQKIRARHMVVEPLGALAWRKAFSEYKSASSRGVKPVVPALRGSEEGSIDRKRVTNWVYRDKFEGFRRKCWLGTRYDETSSTQGGTAGRPVSTVLLLPLL